MSVDPLFADERVDLAVLRERAHNLRWAEVAEDVIPLTAADSDFPIAAEIGAAIAEHVAAGYLSYGPASGLPRFREAIARAYREGRGVTCTSEQVFATNSAASALFLAAAAVLQPGDEVLIPDPVDFLLERSVVAAGGVVRRYRLHPERGYTFDVDEIAASITPRTRMISICSPHNPLGRVWTRAELAAIADLALAHGLTILADEVWSDIVFEPAEMISIASLSPAVAAQTYTVYGFSKGYGLAGLRLGALLCPDADAASRVAVLAGARDTAYGVATLSQIAGVAALERAGGWQRRFLEHLRQNRDLALARLRAMPGVRCHRPEGTFVVFPDVSALGLDEVVLAERLHAEARVAVVPGSPRFFGPGAAGHLRLSLATSRGLLVEALDRLEGFIQAEARRRGIGVERRRRAAGGEAQISAL